ncbi:MAG: DNA-binding protein [archaeon]
MDAELEELKQQRAFQLKQAEQQAQAEAQLKQLLDIIMTQKAKERIMNVRLVNKELYLKAAQYILLMYRAGKLQGKLEEEGLIQLLKSLSQKREIKIVRK